MTTDEVKVLYCWLECKNPIYLVEKIGYMAKQSISFARSGGSEKINRYRMVEILNAYRTK